jgi:DNA excision repair protein ERCC-2
LQPLSAHRRMLGLSPGGVDLSLPNPFPSENCRIIIDSTVTTLYRKRADNVAGIAQRIDRFFAEQRCNTLTFFPSFELMRRIIPLLSSSPVYVQSEQMRESDRASLLNDFITHPPALLCSVMGGIFAEGIDLPGKSAEAAVIVGVGLPQVNLENELIRAYYDRRGDNGFDYAYLYPGMRRVVQAAGRIIRSAEDRGVILLLDSRYEQKAYQRLMPAGWKNEL